MRKKH